MKNTITSFAIAGLIAFVSLSSCNNASQNAGNMQNNQADSIKNADSVNTVYLTDVDNYRKETADKITANNQSIIDFKARIENKKSEAKADYERRITDLQQRNTDMKKRMDDYRAEGKDKWELFKAQFDQDMYDLSNDIKKIKI